MLLRARIRLGKTSQTIHQSNIPLPMFNKKKVYNMTKKPKMLPGNVPNTTRLKQLAKTNYIKFLKEYQQELLKNVRKVNM